MKKITFKICLTLLCFFATSSFAQNTWKESTVSDKEIVKMNEIGVPTSASVYSLNISGIQSRLVDAPVSGTFSGKSNTILELPDATGELKSYRIEEASVMAPELQAKYPEIRSYAGYGENGEYLRFTVTPYNGLNGIILYPNRSKSVIIQDIPGSSGNKTAIFNRSDRKGSGRSFECTTEDEMSMNMDGFAESNRAADDSTLRTFDLAMSVTAEYSAYHGNTLASVNAAIATTVTRQNSVYEIDFAVRLVLIADNDDVIYFTPGNPYSSVVDDDYNSDLQSTLTSVIGEANYDVGHLMAAIGNNGNAGCIGCICVNGSKGSGFTTSTVPIGDNFDIDFVAHELGHQFGGNHTYTFRVEGGIAQMEPGSGSTIMGYAGITGATDVQAHSDPYFHAVTIQQVTAHAKSRSCDVETATGNAIPVVNAGGNVTMPIGTPFKLTGSATDANGGDVLTYCWEQYDEENAANAYPDPSAANNNMPIFRSYNPSTSPTRTFPEMSSLVANGVNGATWEKVPTVGRSADFRLTVRDNRAGGAGNSFDDMRVTWNASYGPFEVITQNTAGLAYDVSEVVAVNWNVNNTTALPGSTNVNILLSTDGGVTYPTTLASNVPNDGTESVTLPATEHQRCRIMIEPTGNDYFAINTEDFAIGYSVAVGTVCTTYNFNTNLTSTPNNGAFDVFGGYNVPDSGIITDVNVTYDVTGSNSDMHLAIISAGGTRSYLYVNQCATGGDMQVTFDDEAAGAVVCGSTPTTGSATTAPIATPEPLSGMDGEEMNGDWSFMIANIGPSAKIINSVALEICREDFVYTPLSVADNQFDTFGVYPNPSNGEVTISLSSNKDVEVSLFDIRGRKVYGQLHNNTSDTFNEKVDFSSMASGVYMLSVESGSKRAVKKLVIQ